MKEGANNANHVLRYRLAPLDECTKSVEEQAAVTQQEFLRQRAAGELRIDAIDGGFIADAATIKPIKFYPRLVERMRQKKLGDQFMRAHGELQAWRMQLHYELICRRQEEGWTNEGRTSFFRIGRTKSSRRTGQCSLALESEKPRRSVGPMQIGSCRIQAIPSRF